MKIIIDRVFDFAIQIGALFSFALGFIVSAGGEIDKNIFIAVVAFVVGTLLLLKYIIDSVKHFPSLKILFSGGDDLSKRVKDIEMGYIRRI